jgi:hypothetical protein
VKLVNASNANDPDFEGVHTRKRVNHPKQDETNENV